MTWLHYALLSALAAAFVPICGKIGMKHVDENLATALRSIVMTIFLLTVATALRVWTKTSQISAFSYAMIVLSGLAGAASWLFYFHAVKLGEVSRVAPIDKLSVPLAALFALFILREHPSAWNWIGILLITGGAYLAGLPKA